MKSLILGIAILCISASVWAQPPVLDKGAFEISVLGGASLPVGSLSDVAKTGYAIGGGFGYFVAPRNSIGVMVVYNSFGVDEVFEEFDIDATISFTEITGYWKGVFTEGGVQPYGRLFGGLYYNKVGASTDVGGFPVEVSVTESDFGIGAGFGVQFRSQGALGGFAEVLIASDFTEGDTSNFVGIRGGLAIFHTGT